MRQSGSTWNRHPLTLTRATCVSATRVRLCMTVDTTWRRWQAKPLDSRTKRIQTCRTFFAILLLGAQPLTVVVEETKRPKGEKTRPRLRILPIMHILPQGRRHVEIIHCLIATAKMASSRKRNRQSRKRAHVCGLLM
jgi:hypothetical protein